MATAEVRNRSDLTGQHRVRFSNIQYHDSYSHGDKEHETNLPTKSAAKQRYFKYAQNTDTTALEGLKSILPGLDTKLKVDHQHYEQWARVPNKRVTNSILLRGIQQLKARAKRETLEEENPAISSVYSRTLQSRDRTEVNPKEVVLREVYQKDVPSRLGSTKEVRFSQKDGPKREPVERDSPIKEVMPKSNATKEMYVRESSTKERDKAEAKVTKVFLRFKTIENVDGQTDLRQHGPLQSSFVDSSGLSRPYTTYRHNLHEAAAEQSATDKDSRENYQEPETHTTSGGQVARELLRSRYGIQKLRERSPFPVSVMQQKYYGEPVFLVSDPYKHHELPKSRTRLDMLHELTSRADSVNPGLNGLRPKVELTEIRLPGDTAAIQEEFYRSKSFIASFPSKKQPLSRTPAQVPSADFCDISQLEDSRPRHSAYASLLERSRTESAFSCKTPHLLKWVPRVQRMKELLK